MTLPPSLNIHYHWIRPLVYRGPPIPEEFSYLRYHIAYNPILQQISRSKETIYIEDAHAWEALEKRFGGNLGAWRKGLATYRSWLVLPLIVKGELIGVTGTCPHIAGSF